MRAQRHIRYQALMHQRHFADDGNRVDLGKGKCEGRKAYGNTPAEQVIIAQMLALKKVGYTMAEIAKRLNTQGIKPRTPAREGRATIWHPTTVQRILARV